jgi:hypothetical protein
MEGQHLAWPLVELKSNLPSNLTMWAFKGKIEDNNAEKHKYEAKTNINVNP